MESKRGGSERRAPRPRHLPLVTMVDIGLSGIVKEWGGNRVGGGVVDPRSRLVSMGPYPPPRSRSTQVGSSTHGRGRTGNEGDFV